MDFPSKKITEKEFQQQILELAKLCGWLTYHTYDSRRCTPGFPDLVMIKGKRLVVAELKVGNNKLTSEQERWITAFLISGVESYIWKPEHWEEIEQVLTGKENDPDERKNH